MLNDLQRAIIEQLARSPLRERFYWTGGTLLAERYLHHRRSDDVDLFSDASFTYEDILPFVREVQASVALDHVEEHRIFDRWEFTFHDGATTRLEFVHYNFPALHPREEWMGVRVDSLDDLAANKVMAAMERHEPKDAVDLYELLTTSGFTCETLNALVRTKFGTSVHPMTFYSQVLLACRQLAEVRPMLRGTEAEQERTVRTIATYFSNESARETRRAFEE